MNTPKYIYDTRDESLAHDSKKVRFIVIKGSESAHCCFQATVIDTKEGKVIHSEGYELNYWDYTVCETFSIEDAIMICDALNETKVG